MRYMVLTDFDMMVWNQAYVERAAMLHQTF